MDNYQYANWLLQNGGDINASLQPQGDPALVPIQPQQTIQNPIDLYQQPLQADVVQQMGARLAGGRPPPGSDIPTIPSDFVNPLVRNTSIANLYNRPDPNTPPYVPNPAAQVPPTDMPQSAGAPPIQVPQIPAYTMHGVSTAPLQGVLGAHGDLAQEYANKAPGLYDQANKAQQDVAEFEQGQAEKKYGLMLAQQAASRQILDADQQEIVESQKYAKQQRELWQTKQEEFFNTHIDPQSFWKDEKGNTNWGKTIMGTLAMALGTFASALPAQMGGGGPNVAKQILDTAIEQNIDAQKANMAKAGRSVDMAQNAYKMALDQTGDDRSAYLMTYNLELKKMDEIIKNQAAESESPRIKANAEATLALNKANQNQNEVELNSRLASQRSAQKLQAAETSKAYAETTKMNASAQPAQEEYVPGLARLNPKVPQSPEQVKESNALYAAYQNARSSLLDAKKYRHENGADVRTLIPGVSGKLEGRQKAAAVNRAWLAYKNVGSTGQRIPTDAKDEATMGKVPYDLGLAGRGTESDIDNSIRELDRDFTMRAAIKNAKLDRR